MMGIWLSRWNIGLTTTQVIHGLGRYGHGRTTTIGPTGTPEQNLLSTVACGKIMLIGEEAQVIRAAVRLSQVQVLRRTTQ